MNLRSSLFPLAGKLKVITVFVKQSIKSALRRSYPHIHDIFSVLRCIWFHFVMLGVGYFALTSTEQAKDMLYVFVNALGGGITAIVSNLALLVFFFAGIFWWSFVMWFTSRMILKSANIPLLYSTNEIRNAVNTSVASLHIRFIISFFPRVSGALPFLFVFIGALGLDTEVNTTLFVFGSLCIAAFLGYTYRDKVQAFLSSRSWVIKILGEERAKLLMADPHRFSVQRQAITKGGMVVAITTFVITLTIFLLLSIIKKASLPQFIGPHGLILTALGTWTVFGSLLVLYSNRFRIPGFLLIFIYTLLVSRCNNNHSVRLTTIPESHFKRETLLPHIDGWMKAFVADSTLFDPNSDADIPVIVVASQGGGIRAMNWTARLLDRLSGDTALPNFYRHVFAMSGVSGGSVGIAVHTAYMHDDVKNTSALNKVVSTDYLSPVTAGLLYPDMFQKFLWWPRGSFDRARRLEDAWSQCYADTLKRTTLDAGFLTLWKKSAKTNYQLPALFLNSVVAESGQKAIVSNIRLDERYFPDAVDVLAETGFDMPLKSAALCSARFPFVTPGGLIQMKHAGAGHLIDGGYLENTGMVTALSIVCALNDYIKDTTESYTFIPKHIKKRFKPVLLFIQNADFATDKIEPLTILHEFGVPPSGFINSWDREGIALDQQMEFLTQRLDPKVNYVKFQLDRSRVAIPLSWYLSVAANKAISDEIDKIKQAGPNRSSYQTLQSLFAQKH